MNRIAIIIFSGVLMLGVAIPGANPQQKDEEIISKKQAQAEIAADSDQYVIGPEDILFIHIWREEALSKTVPVRHDGKISLPLVNEVQAAGLTPLQLREILIKRFQEVVEEPNISVMVMEANSFKVFITGQIKTPGVYRLRSETSLLQLISLAGGLLEWAKQKELIVIRKEKGKDQRVTINYKKVISGEDLGSNIILKPGDTVIVP